MENANQKIDASQVHISQQITKLDQMEQHTKSREEAFERQFRLQKLEKDKQANYLKAEKFQAIQAMEL